MNLEELGTFDIEYEKDTEKGQGSGARTISVHCVLNDRQNINDKVVKVSTNHVYKWLLGKGLEIDKCVKTDSARNISNSYGAHPRTAHWIFKEKKKRKPRESREKTTTGSKPSSE